MCPSAEKHEGARIHYRVKDAEAFRGKDLVILGGGDSALDWTLSVCGDGATASCSFIGVPIPCRAGLGREDVCASRRGPRATSSKARAGHRRGRRRSRPCKSRGTATALTRSVSLDQLLIFWGLLPKLGPIADLGLALNRKTIPSTRRASRRVFPGSLRSATSTIIRERKN